MRTTYGGVKRWRGFTAASGKMEDVHLYIHITKARTRTRTYINISLSLSLALALALIHLITTRTLDYVSKRCAKKTNTIAFTKNPHPQNMLRTILGLSLLSIRAFAREAQYYYNSVSGEVRIRVHVQQ